MSTAIVYDDLTFLNYDFTNPLFVLMIIWLLAACIFNMIVIYRAQRGWLINTKITRQVTFACALAICWTSFLLIQMFVLHRAFTILVSWTGYPLTLIICLQHIELLKMFVSLSDYWTDNKCRLYQIAMVVMHIVITIPSYIWPFGFENNVAITFVYQF